MRSHHFAAGFAFLILLVGVADLTGGAVYGSSAGFDVAPYALPACPPGEYRFEEPRDIARLVVRFRGTPPPRIAVHYLRQNWPAVRLESARGLDDPCAFGWMPIDDEFNSRWHRAAVEVSSVDARSVSVTFRGLSAESTGVEQYDVTFRRTLGLKIDVPVANEIAEVHIYTTSAPAAGRLRVELDSGRRTPGTRMAVTGYNANMDSITARAGVRMAGEGLELLPDSERWFELAVSHMEPTHPYCNDDGLVTFSTDAGTFTVSLASLRQEGPIWHAEQGVYVAFAEDTTSFAEYSRRIADQRTLNERVAERREQTYAGACNGQPRPHPVSTNLGWTHNRQRFRLEPNGDLVLHKWNVTSIPARDTQRYRADGDARFFFGMERAAAVARYADPAPVLAYNIHTRESGIDIRQKSFAVPLEPDSTGDVSSDASVVAMLEFQFENNGDAAVTARLPVCYSQRSARSQNAYAGDEQDDWLVPRSPRDTLSIEGNLLLSTWEGNRVLRARWESTMRPESDGAAVVFRQVLEPGERCVLLLKVPFIALDQVPELESLAALDFDRSYRLVTDFWRQWGRDGAQLDCPEPHLTSLHASHLAHVLMTDPALPGGSGLVNTSVGTSTYGNFTNEACMVIHELDERGLHEEARRRLEVWIKYQGTAPLPGSFTDHDGLYYGAGGFEQGAYNQHHGWALWCIAMHYFMTGDSAWLTRVAPSLVAGCEWVFRQRRNTMGGLPHSRGWERGFLPAGALEDVTDYHYWLSTNAITWRGVETAAQALGAIGHSAAARIRREADAYGADLRRGFEIARQNAPLVRLRDGRWVPHYPSRLYWRGRDVGWIREVLEGSVHLLTSGLYDAGSPQAEWILDDFQDNLYVRPPYSYPIANFEADWYDRGGFSIQPNLLAGLMPHLDRDEPKIFIWMFLNAWCACYREEIDAMVEHPNPALGYSSAAHFKTSDESNAVSWLRAMFVYASEKVLHVGRAIPCEWFVAGRPLGVSDVSTRYGTVSVSYETSPNHRKITATLDLRPRSVAPELLVRFRHPDGLPLRSVEVNGEPWDRFDPQRNDVSITSLKGRVKVEAVF